MHFLRKERNPVTCQSTPHLSGKRKKRNSRIQQNKRGEFLSYDKFSHSNVLLLVNGMEEVALDIKSPINGVVVYLPCGGLR